MKTVTMEDMRNFILNQPNDKPVDMRESRSDSPCGCVMVQYGLANGLANGLGNFFNVGYYSWMVENGPRIATLNFDMDHLIDDGYANRSKTFGELKKSLL